jgi:ribosomal protein S18 acetylase RimI-like enzyme
VAASVGGEIPVVRLARDDDARAIARVHVRAWQAAYRGIVDDTVLDALDEEKRCADFSAWLRREGHESLVAELGRELVAFCSLGVSRDADASTGTGEIIAIYVSPEQARRGAGRALLDASVARARGRYRALTLWVLAANARARRFYEACAFVADGAHQQVTIGGARLDEVRYRRDVTER